MITDDEVMRELERADPARVEDPIPMLDAAGYLDALRSRRTTVTLIGLEPTRPQPGRRRRSRRVARGVLAIAVAATVVTTMVVISRDHTTAPADTPISSPLEEPSRDEVAAASNAGVYVPGSGPTEVTATRSYVSLRSGPQGWAYMTGSANSPAVHYGLLGEADRLVLSPLDDRLFVASPASLPQDPPSAPPAWLIDSVTGQRGALRWVDQPTAMNSPEQVLVLPAPHPFQRVRQFLPRVVDRRDWTIRPLSVPEEATAAVEIHQPGLGRIWIAIAPDGGEVGLAYTDDGGGSWTDVELPDSLRPTSDELPDPDADVVLAATGNNVAVAMRWNPVVDQRLFVSADAGETWDVVPVDATGNGQLPFVIDERLVFAVSFDYNALTDLFVSNSASDWSRLEEIEDLSNSAASENPALFNVGQRGVASLHTKEDDQSIFSTDLSDWWSIPSLPDESWGPGQ